MQRVAPLAAVIAAAVMITGCGGASDSEITEATSARRPTSTTSTTTDASSTSASTSTVPPSTSSTAAPPTTSAPTTTAPPAAAPSWDEIKGASIPEVCTHPPTTLVDGEDLNVPADQGRFRLLQTLPNGQPGLVSGVPSSDRGPLTAVVATCNAGGVGWPNTIAFFSAGGAFYAFSDLYEADWVSQGMDSPGRDGVELISIVGDEVEVYTSALLANDTQCCPSSWALLRLRAGDGQIRITSLVQDLGD